MITVGLIRGVLTLLLMLAFIGMVFYVYSRRNRSLYDSAASLPLEDDAAPAARNGAKQ